LLFENPYVLKIGHALCHSPWASRSWTLIRLYVSYYQPGDKEASPSWGH
jgi:hypothetical protein